VVGMLWSAVARSGRTAHLQTALSQSFEGLRRGDFVDQVEVDIEQRRRAGLLMDSWESHSFSMIVRDFIVFS